MLYRETVLYQLKIFSVLHFPFEQHAKFFNDDLYAKLIDHIRAKDFKKNIIVTAESEENKRANKEGVRKPIYYGKDPGF